MGLFFPEEKWEEEGILGREHMEGQLGGEERGENCCGNIIYERRINRKEKIKESNIGLAP